MLLLPGGHCQRAWVSLLPSLWINYNGVRLVNHARDEGLAMLAWHLSHFDDISTRVGPVQVTSHPIHCYTTRHLQLFDLVTSREAFRGVYACVVCQEQCDWQFVLCVVWVCNQHYLQVGDPALALPSVTVRVGRSWQCGRSWKFIRGDAACVPVGPEDAVSLDVQVHCIDSHAGIALEGLLISPVGHAGIQAADFIVVRDIENLSTAVHA